MCCTIPEGQCKIYSEDFALARGPNIITLWAKCGQRSRARHLWFKYFFKKKKDCLLVCCLKSQNKSQFIFFWSYATRCVKAAKATLKYSSSTRCAKKTKHNRHLSNRRQKVCFRYQGPEDVDGEEGDGEGNEADRLQSALQLQMVLRPPQTQPARDGRQGRDEEEACHVAQQGALLTAWARVLQPLRKNTRVNEWAERQRFRVSCRLHWHQAAAQTLQPIALQQVPNPSTQPGKRHLVLMLW